MSSGSDHSDGGLREDAEPEEKLSSHDVPPRPDQIDRQQREIGLQKWGEQLQAAANDTFPNTTASRYRNVYVLILKWEDEDPQLPVTYEISNLEGVFRDIYNFQTETREIPDDDCHDKVNQKILDFKRLGGNSKDHLKIIYYAGHGKLTRNRALSWTSWRNNQKSKCPSVKWSGIQHVVEEASSDVLLLMDCCSSGTSNTNEGSGITELLAACDYRSIANGVGPFSFTNALVKELCFLAGRDSFSVLELSNNVYFRVQSRIPEDGRERHPAPIHLVLTNDIDSRQSIQLSKLPTGNIDESRATEINQGNILQNSVAGGPRLVLAFRLRDDVSMQQLSIDRFTEWLQAIPTMAERLRIEAGYMPDAQLGYIFGRNLVAGAEIVSIRLAWLCIILEEARHIRDMNLVPKDLAKTSLIRSDTLPSEATKIRAVQAENYSTIQSWAEIAASTIVILSWMYLLFTYFELFLPDSMDGKTRRA